MGNFIHVEGDKKIIAWFEAEGTVGIKAELYRVVFDVGLKLEREAKKDILLPKRSRIGGDPHPAYRTGNLFRAIGQEGGGPVEVPGGFDTIVSVNKSVPYAKFVEGGTGRYGPFKRDIVTSRPMKFSIFEYGSGGNFKRYIITHRVKGQIARHFMRNAYRRTERDYLSKRLDRAARNIYKQNI